MDLTIRSRAFELMDDPNMGFEELKDAYTDINRCNKWLGGDDITINAVWNLIKGDKNKSYTILDMGCGDGTMLLKLSKFLNKYNVSHRMIGVDLRDDVLQIAQEKTVGYPNIEFRKMDILKADSSFECDILINTLTMHHFDEERIDAFLMQFVKLAKSGVVINDLHRSGLAYYLFKVFSHLFLRTEVARYDGLVSILKGFKKRELVALSKKIPDVMHEIRWKWAFRYVWTMKLNPQY
ncbi:methyltransferase domain-containing protein [Flagellimonas sp. S3867]|uniref:methyltransferase domain-containing protein n=1 Tax=Flagellimonas sp. S3867 TaxID=2768063 RepID=UPI001688DDFA|nr:methyltransferase domain-containing protein [Flagellimonas sp. S3867]